MANISQNLLNVINLLSAQAMFAWPHSSRTKYNIGYDVAVIALGQRDVTSQIIHNLMINICLFWILLDKQINLRGD